MERDGYVAPCGRHTRSWRSKQRRLRPNRHQRQLAKRKRQNTEHPRQDNDSKLEPPAGVEPATCGLQGSVSRKIRAGSADWGRFHPIGPEPSCTSCCTRVVHGVVSRELSIGMRQASVSRCCHIREWMSLRIAGYGPALLLGAEVVDRVRTECWLE